MCGIAGIVDLKGTRDIDRDALQRMTDALTHRGPDGEGFFTAPGVGFGHRRLAIIDREGGAQPFHTQSGEVLCYNGEIYNYKELAKTLTRVELKTHSDTELLAEGVAQKGPEFLHQLRGMFAFAFWSPSKRRLVLARDRLGERPLYYTTTSEGFLIFASEFGAVIASHMVETSLDPPAVADYFYYGYVPDPKTIYRNIHKLPPAHTLIASPDRAVSIERYWRPVFTNGSALPFDEAASLLQARVDDAVRGQMMSDVPLGAFLSGGVDSASIFSSMAQTQSDLVACTIGFDEATHDERDAAREIADKFGATHHEGLAQSKTTDLIDRVAVAFGEPFADASALPSYQVAQIARQHVTVALSGDGGDEIFAGYRRYPFFLAEEKMRRLAPQAIRLAVFGPAGALYPKLDWAPRPFRAKTTLQALAQSSGQGYAAAAAINLPTRARAILSADFRRTTNEYDPRNVIVAAMDASGADDPLARAQYADLMTWLPGRMLTKVDRTAMAHGLEVRPPLLDHTIVEWAGAQPGSYKLSGQTGKRILKSAFTPRLGEEFINRKKQGFAPPLAAWMRRDIDNPVMRLETSRLWRESGIFDEVRIRKMIKKHQSGHIDCAQELWSVIMFDAFLSAVRD